MKLGALLIFAATAGCGGGGSSPPAPGHGGPPDVSLSRSYAGTRTVVITGSPPPGSVGPATYAVSGIESDLLPGTAAPSGTTVDRRAILTYSGGAPPTGMRLQTETLDRFGQAGPTGLSLLAESDATVSADQDAVSVPGTQFTDTRAVLIMYPNPGLLVPSASGGALPFPIAATTHFTDNSVETSGSFLGAVARAADFTRIAGADGSFDETGFFSSIGVHAIHQRADGSATSHDQIPGFQLRDVAATAPSGGTIALTLQTQGRTIGNPPVTTTNYTTPVWYGALPLASATLNDAVGPLAPACALASPALARRLTLSRMHVDVPTGTRVVQNQDTYVDGNAQTVCRITTTTTTVYDVTTGALQSTTVDTTALHSPA